MNLDLGFYWALLLRRLPVMILFVLLFSGMGLVAALKLPDVYSTSARLLFEEPLIPDSMVSSTVRASAAEQLEIIEQRLLTRANLIDIANRFNAFEDMDEMAPDTVVAAMRDATSVRRTRGGRGDQATLMTISFKSRSPQIAANIVNEFVTLVLDENARFRAARAENTLEFFEQEVERLNGDLDRQSAEISVFKSENANALPQDQAYRLGRQTLLQERLASLERDLKGLDQRRESLQRTFEATGSLNQRPRTAPRSAQSEELLVSKAELENLRKDYSEDNPRIMRLKNRIDRLEAIVSVQNARVDGVEEEDPVSSQQALLDATFAEIDSEAETLQATIDRTTAELEELQKNIASSASNAIQLAELERDYEIIQTRYSSAVTNLNASRMSERLESTAQGQRITVIENANVPRVPSGPDRLLIAAGAIIAGIGLAVGYFALLEVLNRVIRRPAELSERFSIEPIATIPYMESRGERVLRRTGMITTTLAVLIAVPVGLWYVDTHYLPLELIVQKGLDKLGLG
ncbi:GumC family protein [Thalassococcus sp. BH17M4-6]|uniref:GumC family protein n=1 Tax=Thalassococcus sp. BH17M4-6 TaxID=3413148 RepID=UPI003BDAF011